MRSALVCVLVVLAVLPARAGAQASRGQQLADSIAAAQAAIREAKAHVEALRAPRELRDKRSPVGRCGDQRRAADLRVTRRAAWDLTARAAGEDELELRLTLVGRGASVDLRTGAPLLIVLPDTVLETGPTSARSPESSLWRREEVVEAVLSFAQARRIGAAPSATLRLVGVQIQCEIPLGVADRARLATYVAQPALRGTH